MKILFYIFFTFIIIIAIGVIAPLLPIPGNYQILTVLSGSMEPAIKTGSIIIVKSADNYKIGDVITFSTSKKTPTTHRIYNIRAEVSKPIYITKGDANNAPDQREIFKKDIIGKVLFSIPYVGYAVDVAKKPFGFILIIVIPAVIIVYDEIRKIIREIKRLKKSKLID